MERIHQIWQKCKTEWFTGLVFILGVSLAFNLGRLSVVLSPAPVLVSGLEALSPPASAPPSDANFSTIDKNTINNGNQEVVASRQGSKYHWPWCAGAKRIKPENLIKFASPLAARSAGLEPASNCPGLD